MGRYILLICFLLAVLVYSPSLFNGFVWDDEFLIVYNPVIKHWDGIIKGFGTELFYATQEQPHLSFYRPFITAFNTLSYQLFDFKPVFYHLTNIIIHLFNIVLVWILLDLIFRPPVAALGLATAAFALHPIHTENVCFISGRTDLLASSFFLLGLVAYLSRYRNPVTPTRCFLTAALFFFIIGMLCKEVVIVLPLVILIFDYFLSPWPGFGQYFHSEKKQVVPLLVSFFVIVLLYGLVRFLVIQDIKMVSHSLTALCLAMLTMTKVFYHYLLLTILPFRQLCLYEGYFNPMINPFGMPVVWALLGGLLIFLLAIYLFLKKNPFLLPLFWFIITLVPVTVLIPRGILFAERFLYLPSIALSIFLVVMLQKIEVKRKQGIYWVGIICIVLLLSYYAVATFSRCYAWKDNLSLWTDAVKKNPHSGTALISLGEAQLAQGNLVEAERNLNKAYSLASTCAQDLIFYRLAEIDYRRDDYKKAIERLAKIKEPELLATRLLVLKAKIAHKQGQPAEAEKLLHQAIANSPWSVSARLGLVELLYQQKQDMAGIIELCDEILDIQPRYVKALLYKGLALRDMKQYDKAIAVYEQAIRLQPANPEPYLFLGDLYEGLAENIDDKYWEKALTTYGRLLIRDDKNIAVLLNMGLVYKRLGKNTEAHNLWSRILKLEPGNKAALHNLQLLNREVTGF